MPLNLKADPILSRFRAALDESTGGGSSGSSCIARGRVAMSTRTPTTTSPCSFRIPVDSAMSFIGSLRSRLIFCSIPAR